MTSSHPSGARSASLALAVAWLLACGAGLVAQTHAARQAEARTLAEAMLGAYIDGDNGYQELRDFYERRRGTDLQGVRVLDPAGDTMKNRYPRDFAPSGWRVTAPIVGKDGVVRDVVELDHRPLPPVGTASLLWALLFGVGVAVGFGWREREGRREAEARQLAAEAARREAEAREAAAEAARGEAEAREAAAEAARRELEARQQAQRLGDIWTTFEAQMADDASQLTNHIQGLNGFIAKMDISLKDAVHDLYKAPLLGTGDLTASGQVSTADVKSFLQSLQDRSVLVTREEMAAFVRNVDETMEAIKWVVDSLPDYANQKTEAVDPVKELRALLDHLPPALRQPDDGLEIDAALGQAQPPVMFNPVHFRSVMKNGLYNAVAAIRRANRHREAVPGRVTFRFEDTPERLGVVIDDNGDGLSEAALARLYRGRVEQTTRRRRGGKGSLIVSSYLSFHGATSEVANRPDGGARVVFWFTKATSAGIAAAAESSPRE